MRAPSILKNVSVVSTLALMLVAACGNEQAGREAARKRAAEEDQAKAATNKPAEKLLPPVPGGQHVACETLLDVTAFGAALGEKEPLTLRDGTAGDAEAVASCSLIRGGKTPSDAEQKAIIKRDGVLGVIAGDEVCNITAYCWTIEDETRFEAKCKGQGLQADQSTGAFACMQTVATGEYDVQSFKFLDPDTKCILKVRGGPGMVDNKLIATCAKTARDLIGPNNIKPGPATPPAAPAAPAAPPAPAK